MAVDSRVVTLKNGQGFEVHLTTIGAAIQRLLVPDSTGAQTDVVLGFDDLSIYETDGTPYFGAIVGRVANRIANATFKLDGKQYKLPANNGVNCLHGGITGFNRRLWQVAPRSTETTQGVTFTYRSANGEEGFPGNLDVSVAYEVPADEDELRITITANTDQATLVNIAGHSYFNLGGHSSGSTLDHLLQLDAHHYTPVNEQLIPTGEVAPVAGTVFDFTRPRAIGERAGGAYDHNFVLFGLGSGLDARDRVTAGRAAKEPTLVATATDPETGRTLEVLTTAPGVQLYAGGGLSGVQGKGGARYEAHAGFCLETQGWPDAINQPAFPSVVLRAGQRYEHVVVYRFSYRGASE